GHPPPAPESSQMPSARRPRRPDGGPAISVPHLGEFAESLPSRVQPQRFPRRPPRRVPRRRLPTGARRARRRVLHPTCVEGRPPAALVVLGQLKVEALATHPGHNVAEPVPSFYDDRCLQEPRKNV